MAMINYADKVALNQNSNIADINKVKADDMNELKNAFNNQVAFGWYKTGLNPTFTYSSWDSTTKTGVVNTNLDLTGYLSVGMKVKFTQNATTKYGIITAISSSTITVFMGTDYTLTNNTISDVFYSMLKAPFGFPLRKEKWSIIVTDNQAKTITTPDDNTWYNILEFKVPVGNWEISYDVTTRMAKSGGEMNMFTTLATNAGREGNSAITSVVWDNGTILSYNMQSRSWIYNITSETTFYLNIMSSSAGSGLAESIGVRGNYATNVLKAVCTYL